MATLSKFGDLPAGRYVRLVLDATTALPNNWLGLRLAILLRRIVTMRMPAKAGIDVERFGMRMRLHPRDNGCEKGVLFTPQMFEVIERTELFAEIARAETDNRDFVFVDIGANVGLFSLLVASRAGARADILAFEPDPQSLERLRFNVAANPGLRVRILPHALGAEQGSVALAVDHRDRGGTKTIPLCEAKPSTQTIDVPCRPLLDVMREENVTRIDALKIDVEGNEDRILGPFFAQADRTLWPHLIVIEDTRDLWQMDLLTSLETLGYRIASRSKLNLMLRRDAV